MIVKKVLITGGLGYLGSMITAHLAERGYECVACDTGFFKDCTLYPPVEMRTILKDMRHFTDDSLEGIDAVIHLAAISNDPFGNLEPERIYDPTRVYALELAKLCKEKGIKFIFPSSCSVYGIAKDQFVNEDSGTYPQTPYSLNKLQIEEDLAGIADEDFTPICLRLATVFGLSPRIRFDLVINMLTGMAFTEKRIILNSDGRAWRPNVHINDVCKAFEYAINFNERLEKPLVLNVGDTSQNFQILQIAEMIKKQVPGCELSFLHKNKQKKSDDMELVKDRKIQDGVDTRTYKVSFERIKNVFPGFKCEWDVQRGVAAMLDQFKKLNFSKEEFKNINYYRLQKIEFLHKNNYLTDDLFWAEKVGVN